MVEPKRKKYKLCLRPEYEERMVSHATHKRWITKANPILQKVQLNVAKDNIEPYVETENDINTEEAYESWSHEQESGDCRIFDIEGESTDAMNNDNYAVSTDFTIAKEAEETDSSSDKEESTKSIDINMNCDDTHPTSPQCHVSKKQVKNENTKKSKNLLHSDQRIMFPESHITVQEVLLMITGFTLKFGICNEGRQKLVDLFKLCAGPRFSNIRISNYGLNKVCEVPSKKVKSHYYCSQCYEEIYCSWQESSTKETITCNKCNLKTVIDASNDRYFLTIDLEYQLRQLMKIECVRSALEQKTCKTTNETSLITDITDGELYKRNTQAPALSLSINFSTDGAPIFHKSKRSMWPLQIILNDLPPQIRFKYVIIIGVMIVKKEPNSDLMNSYLKTFVHQVQTLHTTGFKFDLKRDGIEELIKVSALCCSVDSVARAQCQNRVQHNGYYSCSYCYIQGKYIKAMCFPFGMVDDEKRTHESHVVDMLNVSNSVSKLKCRGVKGFSILCDLPDFDMIWGFPYDTLHTADLGVVRLLWELILKRLSNSQKKRINELLMNIKPPHDVGTLPKDIGDCNNYKAKNWRSLLLYYSIPVCIGIFSTEILNHYILLVKSFYTLSQTEISDSELNDCEVMLMTFVARFQILYGEEAMRFNVHMLLHVVDSVKKSGPLWATSTYPYEGNIHFIKQLINGSKGVDQQIVKKSMNIRAFETKLSGNISNCRANVENYCENLFSNKKVCTSHEVRNGVMYSDGVENDDSFGSTTNKFFKKCTYRGTVYTSAKYNKSRNWNDGNIQLRCGTIAQIWQIILSDGKCYFDVQSYSTEQLVINDFSMPHVWRILSIDAPLTRVPIEDVSCKIIYVSNETNSYACKLPNRYLSNCT